MKNLKIFLAAIVVILALSACQKQAAQKPVTKQPPVRPHAAQQLPVSTIELEKFCADGGGNWLAEFKECENAGKGWCAENRGTFNECASACRHDPKAEVCTMNCVPVCAFGAAGRPSRPGAVEIAPDLNRPGAALPPVPGGPLVGGDKDAHGCIGSAGYMWCEAKTKCLRIWEEACWPEATDAIKQAFADKYKKPLTDIRVSVGEADATHAKGGVGFNMNGEFGEGGNFLAVKQDGAWKIVFDGNGGVACSTLEPYNFPASMIEGVCSK